MKIKYLKKVKINKNAVPNQGKDKWCISCSPWRPLALALILIFLISLASCSQLGTSTASKPAIEKGIEVEVEIKEGMNLTQVANLLEEKGIIEDAFVFRLFVQQEGKEKNLLPGRYRLVTGSQLADILEEITSGEKVAIYKLVIPEGFALTQIKERILSDIPFIEPQELEDAFSVSNYSSYEFLKGKDSLEGFLFPKTYSITVDYSADDIVEMMITQYQLEIQELDWSYASKNNYDPYDILKVASLIEREAYIPEERPLISSVIYNRLKIGMLLQVDATVRYALDKWEGIVTFDDLKIESPFNTYIYAGLPPTPICNPGIEALKAALSPAGDDYLYYVVINENTHEHKFSKTLEEHVNATNQ